MCICVYDCMHVCINVCTYVSMCVYTHVNDSAPTDPFSYIYIGPTGISSHIQPVTLSMEGTQHNIFLVSSPGSLGKLVEYVPHLSRNGHSDMGH